MHERNGDDDTCLVEGCTRPVKSRGLCNACYLSAMKLVHEGKTTWEKLAKVGAVKPRKGTLFNQALDRKLAKAKK